MLTTLICTKCGDPVVVTSRSTVLPFVCSRHEGEETVTESKKTKSKKSESPEQNGLTDAMLIDMAEQLKQARTDLQVALEQNEYLETVKKNLETSLTNLTIGSDQCRTELSVKAQQLSELRDRSRWQSAEMERLVTKIEELTKQAAYLGKAAFQQNQTLAKAVSENLVLTGENRLLKYNVEIRDEAGEQVSRELAESQREHALTKAKLAAVNADAKKFEENARYWRDVANSRGSNSDFWEKKYRDIRDHYYDRKAEVERLRGQNLWQRIWRKK